MVRWLTIWMSMLAMSVHAQTISVGAKHFTEGYVLGEIVAQLLEGEGFAVERKFNLGGTLVCFEALRNGGIDVYPEYTGTLTTEILRLDGDADANAAKEVLRNSYDLSMTNDFGFDNTYALVMNTEVAARLGISRISDLRSHSGIAAGLSYEFLERNDGWRNLSKFYDLAIKPAALEHGLAYQALVHHRIELTDAYSTDGEIARYNLAVLEDDRQFFPDYKAVAIYRNDMPEGAASALRKLEGQITAEEMQAMNNEAQLRQLTFREIAANFLQSKGLAGDSVRKKRSLYREILRKTLRHLVLTFSGLVAAFLIAVPLGMLVYRRDWPARVVVYVAGLLQTIPSIALLAFMIPLMGIGVAPAVTALFLYSLLPILRNTVTGLQSVDPQLKIVSEAMGMTRWQQLRWLELPLAAPFILAGIRTAAVINVGTATLAAFIGAGGLGEYIVTGLALNNTELIIRGAVPAAILAIVVELAFEGFERWYLASPRKGN